MDGWINLYKPQSITSATAVSIIKRYLRKCKIGHTGTLDPIAEGVLPLAIGQATKLAYILSNSSKDYIFTIKFGIQTDTGDSRGKIIKETNIFPTEKECLEVCYKFLGKIQQVPPVYSALKINGVRAYKLARQNKQFEIAPRFITIFSLNLLSFDNKHKLATYIVNCSKGTYIRSLAEDISLSLHSLGFVLELMRTRVGIFTKESSINIFDFNYKTFDEVYTMLKSKCLKVENVLTNIPVLKVNEIIAQKVRYGQKCTFDEEKNDREVWLEHDNKILAIGSCFNQRFKPSREFNYKKNSEE